MLKDRKRKGEDTTEKQQQRRGPGIMQNVHAVECYHGKGKRVRIEPKSGTGNLPHAAPALQHDAWKQDTAAHAIHVVEQAGGCFCSKADKAPEAAYPMTLVRSPSGEKPLSRIFPRLKAPGLKLFLNPPPKAAGPSAVPAAGQQLPAGCLQLLLAGRS